MHLLLSLLFEQVQSGEFNQESPIRRVQSGEQLGYKATESILNVSDYVKYFGQPNLWCNIFRVFFLLVGFMYDTKIVYKVAG